VLTNDMTEATVFRGEIYISVYFVKFLPCPKRSVVLLDQFEIPVLNGLYLFDMNL
jgi:hypothetical protein